MPPPFTADAIEAISKVLADTSAGLTGSEINHLLTQCHVKDSHPGMTKWKRLHNALAQAQQGLGHGGMVVGFIHKAMKPARWRGRTSAFEELRLALNEALAFSGLALGADGLLRATTKAETLTEAIERAIRLRTDLVSRGVHPDVLAFCRAELLERNYFHAVLEATKSVGAKLRTLSGLTSDGAELVHAALGCGKTPPRLAINSLRSRSEQSEQRGFVSLLIGLFGMFRNPVAHEARIHWPMAERDAADILSLVSLVHRKLDQAQQVTQA